MLLKWLLISFLKNGEEFAYIRRYKPELSKSVPKFFESVNANNEFPNHYLCAKGNKFLCDGECFGYAMTLATAQDLKRYFFF